MVVPVYTLVPQSCRWHHVLELDLQLIPVHVLAGHHLTAIDDEKTHQIGVEEKSRFLQLQLDHLGQGCLKAQFSRPIGIYLKVLLQVAGHYCAKVHVPCYTSVNRLIAQMAVHSISVCSSISLLLSFPSISSSSFSSPVWFTINDGRQVGRLQQHSCSHVGRGHCWQ